MFFGYLAQKRLRMGIRRWLGRGGTEVEVGIMKGMAVKKSGYEKFSKSAT